MNIVEIGPGLLPIHERSDVVRDAVRAGTYTAVEISKDKTHPSVWEMVNGRFIEADINRSLPLKRESIDQIWLMNVFGGFTFVPRVSRNGRTTTWSLGYDGVFRKLARAVRPGGQIIIGETYTPTPIGNLDFSEFGLETELFIDERFHEFKERYGFHSHEHKYESKREKPYFLVLTKPDAPTPLSEAPAL